MKIFARLGLTCLTAGLLAAAPNQVPDIPATPAPITKLVSATPFVVNTGFQTDWRAERPHISAGYLLVLQVNPDLVYPHQVATPVLYVGNQTAERINHGHDSGHVIAIVPSEVDDKGQLTLDLSTSLMWFGTPALPEQITAQDIADELTLAQAAGIQPQPRAQVDRALKVGGAKATLADKAALLKVSAPLIERYAPDEKHLADGFLGRVGK